MGGGAALRPVKYHTIDDIPDELVPRFSKRDPDNKLYQTRRWVNFKKYQILYSQQDGVPVHMRSARGRFMHYFTIAGAFGCLAYNIYKFNHYRTKK